MAGQFFKSDFIAPEDFRIWKMGIEALADHSIRRQKSMPQKFKLEASCSATGPRQDTNLLSSRRI